MLLFSQTAFILWTSLVANAAPTRRATCPVGITAADLIQMGAVLGAVANCSAAQFPPECRTAEQAAPLVNQAFKTYKIVTDGEKAALLSLMIFETNNFEFDINHSLNTPGQGTRNLMTFPFILQYALDTPSVAVQAQRLVGANDDPSTIPADTQNEIRALVLQPDILSFSSAMWFYTHSGLDKTGCTTTPGMVDGLKSATVTGWENYITKCVFTTVADERRAVYNATLAVLLAKTAAGT
ncbi:hypothetical protein C8R46DRAFT_1103752 [Mycena filopes]|nr:hypothetical protein C8R46DRAFT_1103752 [Mycena filopes]